MQLTDFENNLTRFQHAESQSLIGLKNARRAGNAEACRRAQQEMMSYHLQIRELVKAEVRKFAAELKLKPTDDDHTKSVQLLKAFATGTRLQRIFRDILSERPHSNRCAGAVVERVLRVLDGMGRREDLAVLLDHPDPAIRANAAAFLMEIMPDRCLPILQELAKLSRWVEAGSIACDALMFYSADHTEMKGQS